MKASNRSSGPSRISFVEITIFITVFLFALGIRLYHVTSPVYDYTAWRQAETAALAQNYYQDDVPFLYPEIDWVGPNGHAEMEFPLFPYLVSWLYALFGVSDAWGRVLSILCSLGTVWAMWDIGRRLSDGFTGVLAAAFFAFSPLAVYFGRSFQPDMMMIFFSTLSLSFALRWNGAIGSFWFYAAALALALGVLLKPPCLIVVFPLLWVCYQHRNLGLKFVPSALVFWFIVLVPASLWYWHAGKFYEETGATFMWHYKDFDIYRLFLSVWVQPKFWFTILFNISDKILAYIGVIPVLIGAYALIFTRRIHGFVLLWLLGMLMLYLGVSAHHIGHDYYSLLAIPPLALTAAWGWSWIREKFQLRTPINALLILLPLVMGTLGFLILVERNWYDKLYHYYDDAIALRNRIPEDALILVMDELLHTPEFFYFVNRNGWHRYRSPRSQSDDSVWLENKRDEGASVYCGLNEDITNNPMKYLQNHPMGRYIRSHYTLQEIGERYFVARLDQPLYGDHIYNHYDSKSLALPMNLLHRYDHSNRDWVSLKQWREADAILLDYHSLSTGSFNRFGSIYEEALKEGFRIAYQNSGRLVLERRQEIEPRPNISDHIIASGNAPRIMENGRMVLGVVEPGKYRVSFDLEVPEGVDRLKFFVFDMNGKVYAQRQLEQEHLQHIHEGERPEMTFTIDQAIGLYATVDAPEGALKPKSVVCMPDVECVLPPQVIQAEQLILNQCKIIQDSKAQRGTAVTNGISQTRKTIVIGPYFEFPDGLYRFSYRMRVNRLQNGDSFEIGIYQADERWSATETFPLNVLKTDYSHFTVSSPLNYSQTIESRLYVPGKSQVVLDVVSYQHKQFGLDSYSNVTPQFLVADDDQAYRVSPYGRVFDLNNNEQNPLMAFGRIEACAWSESTGLLGIDEHGCVYNERHQKMGCFPKESIAKLEAFDISPDGQSLGLLTEDRKVYVFYKDQLHTFDAPKLSDPVQDLLITGETGALVLYGNCEIRSFGGAKTPQGLPIIWANVARALVRHENGYCIVDHSSAIHTSEGIGPIQTPVYKPEDWVVDAVRTSDKEWVMLSKDNEVVRFRE